jgi:hypothetical protein
VEAFDVTGGGKCDFTGMNLGEFVPEGVMVVRVALGLGLFGGVLDKV